jgi:hypothetical protein
MNRILWVLLAGVALTITGCGGSDKEPEPVKVQRSFMRDKDKGAPIKPGK